MSIPMPCTDCSSVMNFPNIGYGTDFNELRKYFEGVVGEFRRAETLRVQDQVLRSLDEVFEECSKEGWHGDEALPITEDAYLEAKRLIMSLPIISFFPMPEIIPEPNGEIALEWSKGNRQVFVVSVSGRNQIVYAGLFGINKTHGTEYFGDSLPSAIMENLRRLYL